MHFPQGWVSEVYKTFICLQKASPPVNPHILTALVWSKVKPNVSTWQTTWLKQGLSWRQNQWATGCLFNSASRENLIPYFIFTLTSQNTEPDSFQWLFIDNTFLTEQLLRDQASRRSGLSTGDIRRAAQVFEQAGVDNKKAIGFCTS